MCCLIRLELLFSEFTLGVARLLSCSHAEIMSSCNLFFIFYFFFTTDTFKKLDKDGSGQIELDFMEVISTMRQSHQHKGRWFVDHTIMCVFVISSTVAEAGDVVEELRLQIKTCSQQHVIGTFVFWNQCVYVLGGTWNHWLLILRGFVWVELVSIKAMQWLQTVFLFYSSVTNIYPCSINVL